ncbi:MAG: prepilin-type N-terminal cleavage/methylation domain-containing protein [Candidatus Acidiferrales bacterium]
MRHFRATKSNRSGPRAAGFTLLETLIALLVLAVGVLGLAAMLADALSYMAASQDDFIAQQKAEEAVETIFTAKYNGNITWAQVSNYNSSSSPQGLFLTGPQPLLQPGPDGLVGSVNDAAATPDYIIYPGADGELGTADDIDAPLSNFTRTITISAIAGEQNLRTVQVVINYTTGKFTRSFTLNTDISAF